MSGEFEIRTVKSNAFCRGCDKKLERGVDRCFYTYSLRNRGQHILFCLDCLEDISNAFTVYDHSSGNSCQFQFGDV